MADQTLEMHLQDNPQAVIGLIGAMDQEIELLKASIEGMSAQTIAGFEFYSGTIEGMSVVLLKSGIGKVNAAIGTSLLLDRFAPVCIINTGSAGGFDPSLNVGDLVISSEVRHHDVDLRVFGYEIGQVARMPAAYHPDPYLVDKAQQAALALEEIRSVEGLIATGDQFMDDPVRVENTRKHFPQMKAVEMEAAAIAQTCLRFDCPFIIIRALSDIAGQDSGVSFDAFLEKASEHCARLIFDMLRLLRSA